MFYKIFLCNDNDDVDGNNEFDGEREVESD